jgi:hypothetical protein
MQGPASDKHPSAFAAATMTQDTHAARSPDFSAIDGSFRKIATMIVNDF